MTKVLGQPWIVKTHTRLRRVNYTNLAVYVILLFISYQFIYPLLRMFTMSFMATEDILNPMVNWIPRTWTFFNMQIASRVMRFSTTLFNSVWFSGILALGQTVVSALTGYALARFNVRFKQVWFVLLILTFILPAPVLLVPRIMMLVSFGEMTGFIVFGTVYPQIAMAFLGQGMFSAILILIFYNFTRMIPQALDEAAAIDGASPFGVFYHVTIKLSVTTMLVVFLLSFVWNWNETYVTGVILRGGLDLITSRLQDFNAIFADTGADRIEGTEELRINEAFRMAGTLVSITPLFALYLLVQKQFIRGIENTGLTGI